ncbi:MAG: ATP F0F1 synthase subunit B' [Hyphomicrobiales bacterium]|nr:MAG: ATP F0F1 synthase subunit B' [Hyphomicrobiales bacterium]
MFISKALAATSEAAHGGGHESGGNFPPFDPTYFASQLLWLAITFGLFYFLMARIVLPRISSILETRKDRISQDLDEAQRLKDESDHAHAAYEQELAQAKQNAHAIAQEAKDKAKADADAQRSKIEETLAKKLSQAEAKIAKIKNAALAEVGTIAADTAETIVKELIGGKLTKAEIAKAITAAGK